MFYVASQTTRATHPDTTHRPPTRTKALGLEVRSVLAIGGIGGLAIGLAGREICENLLNGFLLMTTVRLGGGGSVCVGGRGLIGLCLLKRVCI